MKTKILTKPIFSLLVILGALCWSGCSPCGSGENLPAEYTNNIEDWKRAIFPYGKYTKLTYQLINGKTDPIINMERVVYDSSYVCKRMHECQNCDDYTKNQYVRSIFRDVDSQFELIFRCSANPPAGGDAILDGGIQCIYREVGKSQDSVNMAFFPLSKEGKPVETDTLDFYDFYSNNHDDTKHIGRYQKNVGFTEIKFNQGQWKLLEIR